MLRWTYRWMLTRWPHLTSRDVAGLFVGLLVAIAFAGMSMWMIAGRGPGRIPANLGMGPEWACTVGFGARSGVPPQCFRPAQADETNAATPPPPGGGGQP